MISIMKIKNILLSCALVGGLLALSSCDTFLDRKPLSDVTPDTYFVAADHLAAYTISQYNGLFTYHSGWSQGLAEYDASTDNVTNGGADSRFTNNWRVPSSGGGWDFSTIRYCNYFFEQVLPKYENGDITGTDADIKHYIGEMYFIRAWVYFGKLKAFGDYPIITEVLNDRKDELIEKSVRMPRNEVARFILEDLDKAISMLKDYGSNNNNRINKKVAQVVKSRVALYEATFEKYHKGTGRVPGDANWPGKTVHPNFTLDVDAEIEFFLNEAMSAAEAVADAVALTNNTHVMETGTAAPAAGWNPYFEMYSATNMNTYPEILMWKQYSTSTTATSSHGAPAYAATGAGYGVLKTYIESFLMKDGRPWYAASAEQPYMGDVSITDVKTNRDERLQLFVFGEENIVPRTNTMVKEDSLFRPHLLGLDEQKDITGYRIRKYASFDPAQCINGKNLSTTGCPLFRAVEAYLNYIEADYELNGNISSKSAGYWKQIRERAGITADYTVTNAATDLSQETDWAKYTVNGDVTLLNIRRERRCEFIGENMRWDDLVRWRAMDHLMTEKFIPEGCNLWDNIYTYANRTEAGAVGEFIADGTTASNVSSKEVSKYVRPFQKFKSNNVAYDGYSFKKAYYLSPVPIREIELLSPDESVATSVIYQNPYWPTERDAMPLE